MEMIFTDYQLDDEHISFSIHHNIFNGIVGKDKDKIKDIIQLKPGYKGKLIINNKDILKKEMYSYSKKISLVPENMTLCPFYDTVSELMKYEISYKKLILKNEEKKIYDSLKIVGLDKTYYDRKIKTLSTSERKLIQLAIALLSNPDVIIFEEPIKYLDMKNEKKLLSLLLKIKDQFNKTIVFISDDSDLLYKYTSNLIIAKGSKIIAEGNTNDIYERVDFLKKNSIMIPNLVEITYLAKKKKGIKIDYHKDIRDIIKDIYKHV